MHRTPKEPSQAQRYLLNSKRLKRHRKIQEEG